ncbi:MAG TPA: methionine--tRNA ligase subunit beta [Candidatus Paceibacterota bacterium]
METINYDVWKKVDIRVGKVLAAEIVEKSDKLYKCTISFGELGERTIVSGIRPYISAEEFVGKKVLYIVNLEPRMIMGIESQGMLVAVGGGDEGEFSLLVPENSNVIEGVRAH